jgi:hypothetical protein
MRSTLIGGFALATILSSACLAQQWELGFLGGFGWSHDATIVNPTGSAQAGMKPAFVGGVVFDENLYKYIGGEFRYMFRVGEPQLRFQGTEANTTGYTNIIHYDLMIHTAPDEATIRPYFAGGAGIKVYTGTGRRYATQPLLNFALLTPVNQVEPLISVGGGVKCRVSRSVQLRVDFRAYMTPLPDELFRPVFPSVVHGWVYDFVPTAGVSYVF